MPREGNIIETSHIAGVLWMGRSGAHEGQYLTRYCSHKYYQTCCMIVTENMNEIYQVDCLSYSLKIQIKAHTTVNWSDAEYGQELWITIKLGILFYPDICIYQVLNTMSFKLSLWLTTNDFNIKTKVQTALWWQLGTVQSLDPFCLRSKIAADKYDASGVMTDWRLQSARYSIVKQNHIWGSFRMIQAMRWKIQ